MNIPLSWKAAIDEVRPPQVCETRLTDYESSAATGNTVVLDAMGSQHENQSLEGSINEEKVCGERVPHNRASKVATCKAKLRVGETKSRCCTCDKQAIYFLREF